jgi:hypothetical protein
MGWAVMVMVMVNGVGPSVCRARAFALGGVLAICFLFFLPVSLPSPLPNLHEVVQRARPSYNPRGMCPRWADRPAAPGVGNPAPDSSLAHGKKRGGGVRKWGCCTCKCCRTRKCFCTRDSFLFFFHPNLHEVVQQARPSYNPRGTCPCWSESQPGRVGQSPSPNSSLALIEIIKVVLASFRTRKCIALANVVANILHSQMLSQMLSHLLVFLPLSFLLPSEPP